MLGTALCVLRKLRAVCCADYNFSLMQVVEPRDRLKGGRGRNTLLNDAQVPNTVNYVGPSANDETYGARFIPDLQRRRVLEAKKQTPEDETLASKPHRLEYSTSLTRSLNRLTPFARARREKHADRARVMLNRFVQKVEQETQNLCLLKSRRRFIDPLYQRKRHSFLKG